MGYLLSVVRKACGGEVPQREPRPSRLFRETMWFAALPHIALLFGFVLMVGLWFGLGPLPPLDVERRAEAGSVTPAAPVLGDANCDGTVDSIDALLVLQYHALLIESLGCPSSADANEDGSIDSVDALTILQQVWSVPFEEIEPTGTKFPNHWVSCVYQAAHFAEPSLFVGGSFFIVIRNQSDWQRVWDYAIERGRAAPANHCHEIGQTPSLEVDFEREMVIGVIEQYGTGGHSLDLNRVLSQGDSWTVNATRTAPGSGCLVTAMIEYHHEFVKTTRTDLPVGLSVREVTYDCVPVADLGVSP